jgi:hypothetical protein
LIASILFLSFEAVGCEPLIEFVPVPSFELFFSVAHRYGMFRLFMLHQKVIRMAEASFSGKIRPVGVEILKETGTART